MSTNYPNLPNLTLDCTNCWGLHGVHNPLPEKHKPGNTEEGTPFDNQRSYRLTMRHNGNLFSSRYYHGYNLNTEAVVANSNDETVILSHLLRCAADKRDESGKYELSISVLADNREYDLGIVLPDGSILETVTIEK